MGARISGASETSETEPSIVELLDSAEREPTVPVVSDGATTMRAPICARPAEKDAVDVSALVSQLQLITMTCHTRDQYNALIPRLRPALATKEKNLSAFFKRAYGKQGQTEHDKYITELANLRGMGPRFFADRSPAIW